MGRRSTPYATQYWPPSGRRYIIAPAAETCMRQGISHSILDQRTSQMITRSGRILQLWGLCLALIAGGAASADTKAFVGARVFDGTGKSILEKATIVVQDGRIAAIGPSNKVKPPKGAQLIDVSGKTITPGFI